MWGVFFLKKTQVFLNAGSNASKAVRSSYTATYTQGCFGNISLHGKRTQCPIAIFLLCSFDLNFICCLHLGYDEIK